MAKNIQGAAPGAANSFLASSAQVNTLNGIDLSPVEEVQRVAMCMLNYNALTEVSSDNPLPMQIVGQSEPIDVRLAKPSVTVAETYYAGSLTSDHASVSIQNTQRYRFNVINTTDAPATVKLKSWSGDRFDKTAIAALVLAPGEADSAFVLLGENYGYGFTIENDGSTTGQIDIELSAYGSVQ